VRLIDRYLIREIAPYGVMGFLLLTSAIFLHEASRFSELFIVFSRHGLPTGPLFSLIFSVLPGILVYTVPISLLLGVLMGLGRLSADSEITALRASGVGRLRLLYPLSVLGLAAAAFMLYLTAELLPVSHRTLATLKETRGALAYQGISTQIKPRIFEESVPGKVFYVQEIDRHTNEWRNIFIADTSGPDPDQPKIYTARSGRLTAPVAGADLPEMHLDGAESHTTENIKDRKNLEYNVDAFERLAITFETPGRPVEQPDKIELPSVEQMSLRDLIAYASPPEQALKHRMEIHRRFALPVTCVVFVLIGLAFGVSNQRAGRSYGLLVGLLLTVAFYMLLLGCEQSALKGAIPVWLGAWGPNLGFLTLGAVGMFGRNTAVRNLFGGWLAGWIRALTVPDEDGDAAEPREAGRAVRVRRAWLGFPRLIDRLIISDLVRRFLLATVGLTAVFLIVTIFGLIGQIVENRVPAGVVIGYVLYLSPQILTSMAPLSVLVAVMVTFGLMAGGSQIVALKASGQSIYRLALPVFFIALTLAATLFALQNFVLPITNRQQEDLRQQIRSGQEPARTLYQTDRKWIFGKGSRIYFFRHFDPVEKTFASLSVFDLDPLTFEIKKRVWTSQARWQDPTAEHLQDENPDNDTTGWFLKEGWIREFEGGRVTKADPFGAGAGERLAVEETPEYFTRTATDADKLNFEELLREITELSQSGFDVLDLRIELQSKLAYPLTCLVMALVGLPFAFSVGKRGALFGVAVGLAIGLMFWGALGLFTQMGRYEILPPVLSAWAPNLLFGAAGAYLFLTART
jgi:LPS export ABC transporter permease LptF/LPS export ABC transporter permease LptG